MLDIILGIALWAAVAATAFFWSRWRHYVGELHIQEQVCADMRGKLAASINFLLTSSAKLPVEEREQCFLFLLGTVQVDQTLQAALVTLLRGAGD
jgi:hypothetical protein